MVNYDNDVGVVVLSYKLCLECRKIKKESQLIMEGRINIMTTETKQWQ